MKHFRNSIVAALLLWLVPAAPGNSESLFEAFAEAYRNNPTLRAERAALRATDEQVPQALSGWRPTIQATGSYGKESSDRSDFRSRVLTTIQRGVTIDQPLYRGGRTVAGTRRAESVVLARRELLRSTEQLVLLQAVTAYMDVVRDQFVVELTRNNEKVLTKQLEATVARMDVGELTRTDVAQSKARLAGASSDRIRAEGDLIDDRAEYQRVIGSTPAKLEDPPALSDIPETEEEAVAIAVAENPDLLGAQLSEAAADHAVDEETGVLLPTLSLNGELSRIEDPVFLIDRTDSARITARLSVPLYQAGAVWSRVREARAIRSQRKIQVEETRRSVRKAVTSAWEALQTARSRIEANTVQVNANTIALEGVREEANLGSRTILDVLDAEQELLDSRVALVGSLRDEYVAAYQVKLAIGRLSAERLGVSVEPYDPTEHYDAVRNKWFGFGDD
jgi:TolC family type I secretion outer membrane protein